MTTQVTNDPCDHGIGIGCSICLHGIPQPAKKRPMPAWLLAKLAAERGQPRTYALKGRLPRNPNANPKVFVY